MSRKVKLTLSPEEAARVLKARKRAKLWNGGLDAALKLVTTRLGEAEKASDALGAAYLSGLRRDMLRLRKRET